MAEVRAKTKEAIKKLKRVKKPFGKYWHEWVNSEECFLTEQEIEVTELYLEHKSHTPYRLKSELSISRCNYLIRIVTRKLEYKIHSFYCWLKERNYKH